MKRVKISTVWHIGVIVTICALALSLSSCAYDVLEKFCKHTYTYCETVQEPSLESEGEYNERCSVCRKVLDTASIPKLIYTDTDIREMFLCNVFTVYNCDYSCKEINGQGTGFFIDDKGNFITNAHVVEDAHYLFIELNGSFYEVDKIYTINDETSDYAICHARGVKHTGVKFSTEVAKGDPVYTIGFPGGVEKFQVDRGILTDEEATADGGVYYRTNSYVLNGSSGGVLANRYGEVVGIITVMFANSDGGAIRYSDIQDSLHTNYPDPKSPLETFYETETVTITEDNVHEYFDIEFTEEQSGNGRIDYTMSVAFKEGRDYEVSFNEALCFNYRVKAHITYNVKFPAEKREEMNRTLEEDVRIFNASSIYRGEAKYENTIKVRNYQTSEITDHTYELVIRDLSGEISIIKGKRQ